MFRFDKKYLINKPFKAFIIDDFIINDVYLKLSKQVNSSIKDFLLGKNNNNTFRTETVERYDTSKEKGKLIVSGGGGQNDKFNSTDNIIRTLNKDGCQIKDITSQLSKQIQKKIYRLLIPFSLFNLASLKPLKIHNENSKLSIWDFLFYKNCHVKYKLSAYTSNAGLFQHKDHDDKVISLLLYFGFTDSIKRKGLGTQMYSIRKGFEKWSEKSNPHLDFYEKEKLIREYDVHPYPNRIFGFVKNNISWHAVYPIELDNNVARSTIQCNLYKHRIYSDNLTRLIKLVKKII
tara:strand:- start:65 stop:934 length:870 start_codon:yes stop_codon:yes gene_type:complete